MNDSFGSPTLVLTLSLALATACGPADSAMSLRDAPALDATVYYTSTHGRVTELRLNLSPRSGCPTLEAVASVNGRGIPVGDPGGERSGSYYFVPSTSCARPYFAANGGDLFAGTRGLALELTDATATYRLSSAAAFDVAVAVGRTAFRYGETIVFAPSRPLAGLEIAGLMTLRREGATQDVLGADVGLPAASNGQVSLPVPRIAPGRYQWFLSVRGSLPVETCQGFAACAGVAATIHSEGVLEIEP